MAEEASALPFTSAQDWVGYSSAVVVATIEREDRVSAKPAMPERVVDRRVTVRVDDVAWRTDGAEVPRSLSFFSGEGWLAGEDGERSIQLDDAPYLQVGRQYVLALVLIGDEWGTMPASRFELEDGRIRLSSRHDARHEPFRDMTLEQLSQLLASTEADPVVVRYRHLPPIERAAAVQNERDSTSSPAQ